jgi:PAS domain S-box-containing protein
MHNPLKSGQVVFTNKARCRDCYRCVRVCPVKAIRMHQEQAFVVQDRCISCGTCIRECPQGAKSFRNDVEHAQRLLTSGGVVAASVAPSFAAVYGDWEQKRLASALRKLGFSFIAETAVGAYMVARKTAQVVAEHPERGHICTACPAVVRYVERYQPELIDQLVPVVSPMLAHARHIKEKMGADVDVKVIFIGPCVAKKAEAEDPQNEGLVDCVLTFTELAEWLKRENISMSALEESSFDETPEGESRVFPLVGGSVRTASLTTDILAAEVVSVSGFSEVLEVLDSLGEVSPVVVEPLFCSQGCINGPAIPGDRNVYDRRKEVLVYAEANQGQPPQAEKDYQELLTRFSAQAIEQKVNITEEEVRGILEKTGKSRPEDQLNCGACGYSSCREKAIAVLRGMAEVEMCIPYMKRLAEQRTDRIIETSPNGIVILDDRLNIIHMNPAFRRFFMCSEAVCGKRISYLMDPDAFEKLASGDQDFVEIVVKHERYNLVAHQILYPLKEENQYVGIFVNITHSQANEQKLDQLRAQTIMQARELMEHQITMAQKIGQFLGESTAKGEALVENLMRLAGDESKNPSEKGKGNNWLWDIFTSK